MPKYRFQSTLPGWGATGGNGRYDYLIPFQSTLPGWGATHYTMRLLVLRCYFNPRSPDGERLAFAAQPVALPFISIHAPRMGSDHGRFMGHAPLVGISIHAPRMGSDPMRELPDMLHGIFQSTLPGWGATQIAKVEATRKEFQSTLPGWGATVRPSIFLRSMLFQSTLPGWGATAGDRHAGRGLPDFNPRSPDGERPRKWTSSPTIWAKSSIFNTDCIADRH